MSEYVFQCKMCGGALDVNSNMSIGTCQYCGTKMTLPKLNNDRRANVYERAGKLRRNNEFDKAAALYETLISEDRTDAEAYWSIVLCKYGVEYVEDPATGKRIPTCNRTQFDSIFTDTDYKTALEYATSEQSVLYRTEAAAIDRIQQGILAVARKEKPYDVFICYKESDVENGIKRTEDSYEAQNLYVWLSQKGYRVFFARESLRDKLAENYEPYIFNALNTAKVMIVYGKNPSYINSVWTRNEWSRFQGLIKSGMKQPNSLVVAYEGFSPYQLPDELKLLQSVDASQKTFYPDLGEHIAKVAAKTVAMQAVAATQIPLATSRQYANQTQLHTRPRRQSNTDPKATHMKKAFVLKPKAVRSIVVAAVVFMIAVIGVVFGCLYGDRLSFEYTLDYSGKLCITKYKGNAVNVKIPEYSIYNGRRKIEAIASDVFRENSKIESITMSNGITRIENGAFLNCTALKDITLSTATESIGDLAFKGCTSLTNITIPNSVTLLGKGIFFRLHRAYER